VRGGAFFSPLVRMEFLPRHLAFFPQVPFCFQGPGSFGLKILRAFMGDPLWRSLVFTFFSPWFDKRFQDDPEDEIASVESLVFCFFPFQSSELLECLPLFFVFRLGHRTPEILLTIVF